MLEEHGMDVMNHQSHQLEREGKMAGATSITTTTIAEVVMGHLPQRAKERLEKAIKEKDGVEVFQSILEDELTNLDKTYGL